MNSLLTGEMERKQASMTGGNACAITGDHVFIYAGMPPGGKTPDGWPCSCGATTLRYRMCGECGQEYASSVPNGTESSNATGASSPKS